MENNGITFETLHDPNANIRILLNITVELLKSVISAYGMMRQVIRKKSQCQQIKIGIRMREEYKKKTKKENGTQKEGMNQYYLYQGLQNLFSETKIRNFSTILR